MTDLERELIDAIAVLDAIKPYVGTGWNYEGFDLAWRKAQAKVESLIGRYIKES